MSPAPALVPPPTPPAPPQLLHLSAAIPTSPAFPLFLCVCPSPSVFSVSNSPPDFSLCLHTSVSPPPLFITSCLSFSVSLCLSCQSSFCVSQVMGLPWFISVSLVLSTLPARPSLPEVAQEALAPHPSLRISLPGSRFPISSLGFHLLCQLKRSCSPNFSPPVTPILSAISTLSAKNGKSFSLAQNM